MKIRQSFTTSNRWEFGKRSVRAGYAICMPSFSKRSIISRLIACCVSPVKPGLIPGYHHFLYPTGDLFYLFHRRLPDYVKIKNYPAQVHPLVIVQPRTGELAIAADELLAAERPDPGCLYANVPDRTHLVFYNNKITDLERFVEENDQVAEKVTEDRLGSQGDDLVRPCIRIENFPPRIDGKQIRQRNDGLFQDSYQQIIEI